MRRLGLLLVVAGLVVATACGRDDEAEPGIPTVDFTPSAVVGVDDAGIDCVVEQGDACEVAAGSVIEVRNDGTTAARLQGGDVFDTGAMEPGDTMTVVLVEPGEVEIVNADVPEQTLTLTVTPRQG